ncbi:MAG: response regulator [Candidatus Blackburnbacteria bacterium]|nr:response regulator [Candidatus Blackburnbacteria bacterium]
MARVLLVDDDDGILEAVTAVLEFEGYEVFVDNDPENITKKISRINPDIIVLDLLLAGNKGDDVARDLKADQATSKIPIIMISAHPTAETLAKECGADAFLAKPFDIDELVNTIKKHT